MAGKGTWPEIQNMSLDDVDLQCLLLDAMSDARDRAEKARSK